MPVFNAEDFLETSCKSVFNQTFKDVELICIDDGSTDNSLTKLYELKEKYNFIKILTQENQGSGKARNYGMDNASGEYIAFLDADDIFVDGDALEKMYDFGVKHDANMVGGNLKRVSLEGNLEDNFNYKEGNYAYFSDFDVIKPKEYGIPWAFYKNIFKTEFLNKFNIRFPDLKRGQDPVLLAEVLVNIDEIPVVPVDLYGYNYAVGGGANSKVDDYTKKYDFIKHYKDTFEILENAGFEDVSNKYKEKLAIHLRLNRNKEDMELQEIVWDIFSDNVYYDQFKGKLFYQIIGKSLDSINESNFEDYNRFIKHSFFCMSCVDDFFIQYDELERYFSICNQYSNVNKGPSLKLIQINKCNANTNIALNLKKNNLINELENLKEINQDLDLKFPNVLMNKIAYSYFYNDIHDLRMEIIKLSLDDAELISNDLLERYLNISNIFKNNCEESIIENIEKYDYMLQVEEGCLKKHKEYLKNELINLK